MTLEDYFDYLAPDDIRLKGTRVGIESILYEYIYREMSPEHIARRFPSVTLEQIYATILYYLHNTTTVDAYMTAWLTFGQQMREQQAQSPPPIVKRLRSLKHQHHKPPVSS